MKRYLSMAVILGLVLSLLGTIPAAAATNPYIHETFETETSVTTSFAEWRETEGLDGTGAMYANYTSTRGDQIYQVSISDGAAIHSKDIKVSGWMKLDTTKTKLSDGTIYLLLKENGAGYNFVGNASADLASLNAGNWVYFEKIINWTGSFTDSDPYDPTTHAALTLQFRFAHQHGYIFNGLAADSPSTDTVNFWLDDITVEPADTVAESTDVYATGVSLSGNEIADETLTINYTFNTNSAKEEGDTVIRVKKEIATDAWATVATLTPENGSATYKIPQSALGTKLKFEVVPMTTDGIVGKVQSITTAGVIKSPYVVEVTTFEYVSGANRFRAIMNVENNLPGSADLKVFIAIVLYDENGCAVSSITKNAVAVAGADARATVQISAADVAGFAPIAKAKAFVLGGTNFYDTNMISYIDVLELEK